MSMSFITCTDLRFGWPDGDSVFDGFDLSVGPGRTGLIGANGTGKSTLLRLVAGELRPAAGSVKVAGTLGYLPQNLVLDRELPVDRVLGIAEVRAALAAIEGGDVGPERFAAVGDDWDAEERARAALDRLGLAHIGLDRRIGELSGGETVLLGFAAQVVRRPDVLLLDEPTNNLDRQARHRLYDAVESWSGVLVVVSHDRELLSLVDQIAELRGGGVRWYGGNLADYEQAVATEQEAAERMVRVAEADLRKQKRELVDAATKLARRKRYGQKMNNNKREPKIVMNERKREAQVSAGKHRIMHEEKVSEARDRLADAEQAVRDDDEIRVDLPDTTVPAGKRVLVLDGVRPRFGPELNLRIHGPERIALVGRNGAGKTTLLRTIVGELAPETGEVVHGVPVRYLPQRLDVLDDARSIVANVAALAPDATEQQIRNQLARYLFRGRRVDQPVGTLSGGERFRATLAALLQAQPAPRLLLLDEPTNNLDLASVRRLTEALAGYRGALLVASHDLPFLRDIGVTRWLRMADTVVETDRDGAERLDDGAGQAAAGPAR